MDKTAIDRARQHFLTASVPDKRRPMVAKAFAKTASPRAAIKAHCFVCAGMDAQEAARCSVVLCPLYEYNGYRVPPPPSEGEELSASEEPADEEAADPR